MKKIIFSTLILSLLLLMSCSNPTPTADIQTDNQTATADQEEISHYFFEIENSDITPETRGSEPTEIVLLLWDGFKNKKTINKVYEAAKKNVSGWTHIKGYWLPGSYDISDAKKKIDSIVSDYGKSKSKLLLLVVGKSLGGAKTYNMMYKYSTSFDDFHKTAMVLIDSHEPGAPGKYGRANYWYDYVIFRKNSSSWRKNYDLKWQSRWDSFGSRLAVYNTYQRGHWPQGYAFSRATQNSKVSEDHYSIVQCTTSRKKLESAIRFLLK